MLKNNRVSNYDVELKNQKSEFISTLSEISKVSGFGEGSKGTGLGDSSIVES